MSNSAGDGAKSDWARVERLFQAALERPPEERRDFLDGACADAPELRREVEKMLAADDGSSELLAAMVEHEAAAVDAEQQDPWIGKRIGPYEIFRKLGEGGMGAVYLAGRVDKEFRRQVTIKLVKPGLDSKTILRRFRNERQILAGLDHPNIARLLDGGTTASGQPYFVMEYIEGDPVDEYCDHHKLSIGERLELFRKICSAVQLAHQNLVVHRDLKPANILVTAAGEPKLLDFGVAKLLNPELAAQTVGPTGVDLARLMTPAYASPEQAQGGPITTVTDVYSLGVLLYELLTGRRPYRFESHLPQEIERVICDTEPVKPSSAIRLPVDGDGQAAETASRLRGRKPEALQRELSGDLDNIVLMAMRKESRRRYVSAEQLAEDIRRYEGGLPVIARPDTFGYRTGKFLRRNKLLVAFVAFVVVFAMAMTVLSVRVLRERDVARSERLRAEEVSGFMVNLFKLSDRRQTRGEEVTARDLLDKGVEEIDVRLRRQPQVLAKLLQTMGVAYLGLGMVEPADELIDRALDLRRQLGPGNDLEMAASLNAKTQVLSARGDLGNAEELAREVLDMRRRHLPDKHADVARSLNVLAETLVGAGKLDEAEPLHRRALSIRRELFGNDDLETLDSIDNLAVLLQSKLDYAGAEPLYRESIAITRGLWSEDHPTVANSMNNLSLFLVAKGDRAGAEEWIRSSLAMYRRLLGEDHPEFAGVLSNYGRLLYISGDYETAEDHYRQALAIFRRGPENDNLAMTMNNLAVLLRAIGDYAGAEELYREALEIYGRSVGRDHWEYANCLMSLANTLYSKGDYEAAEKNARESLRILRASGLGAGHTANSMHSLASILLAAGKAEEAETLIRETLDILRQTRQEDNWRIASAEGTLGACLSRRGHYQEAEPLLLKAYKATKATLGARAASTRTALERLVAHYEAWGKPELADEYRAYLDR